MTDHWKAISCYHCHIGFRHQPAPLGHWQSLFIPIVEVYLSSDYDKTFLLQINHQSQNLSHLSQGPYLPNILTRSVTISYFHYSIIAAKQIQDINIIAISTEILNNVEQSNLSLTFTVYCVFFVSFSGKYIAFKKECRRQSL